MTTTQANIVSADWDDTHDSRDTFLAILKAQCAPGQAIGPVPNTGQCADPVFDSAAAVLLALLDPTTSLAIEGQASQDLEWLYAATGAQVAAVADADFVLSTQDLSGVLGTAKRGTPEQPEHGATVIFAGTDRDATEVTISGPGVEHPVDMSVPLSADALEARDVANVAYPMGVDVLIARDSELIAFPRSTQILKKGAEHVRRDA